MQKCNPRFSFRTIAGVIRRGVRQVPPFCCVCHCDLPHKQQISACASPSGHYKRLRNKKHILWTSISSKRRRRRRTSITAGEESEANGTCGFSQLSRQDVLALDSVEREDASAAQPAVMDIRHGRRRLLEIDEHYKHAKMLLCICESSIKKENKNKQN